VKKGQLNSDEIQISTVMIKPKASQWNAVECYWNL